MLSVEEFTFSIGSLFHEMGSLIVKATFSLRWRLKNICPLQVKAATEYVVGQVVVSAKLATLKKKRYSVDEVCHRIATHSYL